MKRRSYKELLIVLRDNIDKLQNGLCMLITELYEIDIITCSESDKLRWYISVNRPKSYKCNKYYYWPKGVKQPRIEWLNEQINKL